MKIYDEDFNTVENPDMEAGFAVAESRRITHRWVIDVQEESHEEVIAEYPETGGKDIAIVVDVEEQGHWETLAENGEAIDYDGAIPDDWPHDAAIENVEEYMLYRAYDEDELAEIAERKRLDGEARARADEREAFLSAAPERIDDTEQAVAELGVLAAGNTVTLEDVMGAIAELGAIVANG